LRPPRISAACASPLAWTDAEYRPSSAPAATAAQGFTIFAGSTVVECLLVHEPTDGKEDQGEAISAKPFPKKTAEYPVCINSLRERKVARRGSSRHRIGFGADVKSNDPSKTHPCRSYVTRPPIDTAGGTSTVESDAVPSGALLMREWIGERDYR